MTWKEPVVPRTNKEGKRMRRDELHATPAFKRAFAKLTAQADWPKRCVHGHNMLDLKNVDNSSLEDGKPYCYTCWLAASKRSMAKQTKQAGKTPAARAVSPKNQQRAGKKEQNLVDLIARNVAARTLAGAKMVPAAQTREEYWNALTAGVRESIRHIGFRPPNEAE